MIEIRVLITDQLDAINIQVTRGVDLLVEDYFKKRKYMDLKEITAHRTQRSFNHALEIALDAYTFKEAEE